MSPITSSDKDRVLEAICKNKPDTVYSFKPQEFLKAVELDFEGLRAILKQFERMGFVSNLNMGSNRLFFSYHLEAADYLHQGGFLGQEVLLKANIEKLLMEIEQLEKSLKPDHLEKAKKIASIASGIYSALGMMPGNS